MPTSRMSQAIHQFCGKMLREGQELNDAQLLNRFVDDHEPAALGALVERHGPMVWGVCRRILSNHHDAEDAFQAAFLVLVRRASSIKPRSVVGSWLYGVARQTALRARATSIKRRLREIPLTAVYEPSVAPPDRTSDLQRLLDDELTKLPAKYRSVLILCELQGISLKDTAQRLGLPPGTVASRLARGRSALAKRLAYRGLAVAAVSTGSLQIFQAASATTPTAVISTTIKVAQLVAASPAPKQPVVSTEVAVLTEGVLRTMFLTKLKNMALPIVVLLGLVGAGFIALTAHGDEAQQFARSPVIGEPPDSTNSQPKKGQADTRKTDDASATKEKEEPEVRHQVFSVSGRAVDVDGKPVAGATVYLVSTNNSPERLLATVKTDKDGHYEFQDVKLPYRVKNDEWEAGSFEVFGTCPKHAFAWSGMKLLKIDPRYKDVKGLVVPTYFPSDQIEIGLEFAPPKKVSGCILNEKGDPIAGVKVHICSLDYVNTAGKVEHKNYREFWSLYGDLAESIVPDEVCAVTDEKGLFKFPSVPPGVFCRLGLEHADYAWLWLYTTPAETAPETADNGDPVLPLPLSLTIRSVRKITVQVRSKLDNKPVPGIRVSADQPRASGSCTEETSDKEGKVTLKLPSGKYRLIGNPPRNWDPIANFARTYADLTVENVPAEQTVILRQQVGCVLILKAVDKATGKGIPKVTFVYEFEKDGQIAGRTSVQSSTAYIDNPVTNEKGDLRAVVQPGKRVYSLNWIPDDYEPVKPEDRLGRELDLPAGKTITETFELRKKQ